MGENFPGGNFSGGNFRRTLKNNRLLFKVNLFQEFWRISHNISRTMSDN